jgi:hypothetical protein
VDNVLIQAEKLVNGATIMQVPCERVEYWHLELERDHDLLFAEGLPAEVYLENGKRTAFLNGDPVFEAYANFHRPCARPLKDRPALQRVKSALLNRAKTFGYVVTDDPDVHIVADGFRIEPMRLTQTRLAFTLPTSNASIELHCRTFVHAHTDSIDSDYRSLGI